jgi:hypothetical protein
MRLWAWYRARGWGWKIAIGAAAALLGSAILYIAGRSLQFAAAEKEAGMYLPSTAQVVLRAKDLEGHAGRLQETLAWKVIRRRVLKDPAIRPLLNGALKENGLPTLDELEDERNSLYSADLLMRGAGRDAAAALQVGPSWNAVRFFAATRLRWSDYLLTPFARFALPTESVGGATAFRLVLGKMTLYIAFEGRLALVSNDRPLLEQALRRQGTESRPDHPVTARVEFGTSKPLLEVRAMLADAGVLPQIRMDTVRAVEVSADLSGPAALLDVAFEGAEPTRPEAAPPHALAKLAPPNATGTFVSPTGPRELFDWLRSLVRSRGPNDPVGKNLKEALESLDEVGFSSEFLPRVDGGMTILTGAEENNSRVFPALAILVPSKDPKGAVEALCRLIRVRGGLMAENRFKSFPVGDTLMWSFQWPESGQINDFARPCFAAIPEAFVFGNNFNFTQEILRNAAEGGGRETAPARRLQEYGIAVEPALGGGHLLLPALRESLDGPIPWVSKFLVEATVTGPAFRAQIEAELRQQGRSLPGPEIDKLFFERMRAKEEDQEEELRASLHVLDRMKWVAFSMRPGPKAVALRAAIEFQ